MNDGDDGESKVWHVASGEAASCKVDRTRKRFPSLAADQRWYRDFARISNSGPESTLKASDERGCRGRASHDGGVVATNGGKLSRMSGSIQQVQSVVRYCQFDTTPNSHSEVFP